MFLYNKIISILIKTDNRIKERQRRIVLTVFTSILVKCLLMGVPLITLKVSYDYLGKEIFGLWNAITAFFAIFTFSDLGLGNGLQTLLSQADGKDDLNLKNKLVSNTFIVLLSISVIVAIIYLSVFSFINWNVFFNVQTNDAAEVSIIIISLIFLSKIITIPFSIVERSQLALQEAYKGHIWIICGLFFSIPAIVVCAKLNIGKIALIASSVIIPLIAVIANFIYYFYFNRKKIRISFKLYDSKILKKLLSIGLLFCCLSLLTTIGLAMDTFIVAKTCSLADASSYAIIWRISAVVSAVISILSVPLWGANGEALSRGDYSWILKNTKRMSKITFAISFFALIFLAVFIDYILKLWLGKTFDYSYVAFLGMCLMNCLLAFISPYFMVLNAFGKVKIQIYIFIIYTPITFVLKYYLTKIYGASVTPYISFVLYLFVVYVIYSYTNVKLKKNFIQNEILLKNI